jgi:hypothetical protein
LLTAPFVDFPASPALTAPPVLPSPPEFTEPPVARTGLLAAPFEVVALTAPLVTAELFPFLFLPLALHAPTPVHRATITITEIISLTLLALPTLFITFPFHHRPTQSLLLLFLPLNSQNYCPAEYVADDIEINKQSNNCSA